MPKPRIVALLALTIGCTPSGAARPPTLQEVAGAVDARRVLECARQPTPADKARCLGVEALSAGLGLALDRAAELAADAMAALSPAGAGDVDADDPALAAELAAALEHLRREIAAARDTLAP